jgi:hypothetical protein
MSPPTYTATPVEPLPGVLGLEGEPTPSLSWAKGQLMREFGLTSTQARRMVVAFVLDERDRLHRMAMAARSREVREVLAEELRQWYAARVRKLTACDQRVGGPNWRLTT